MSLQFAVCSLQKMPNKLGKRISAINVIILINGQKNSDGHKIHRYK